MAWESAERVQKNDAGEYRALINGEWMPVAKAQKNEAGQYRVDRGTPETVQSEPATANQELGGLAGWNRRMGQTIANVGAGALRGAGSIGATLLSPIDIANDAIAGRGLSLESNRARRAAIDSGLKEMGADPESLAYQGGKLGAEIAGTAGIGGGLAKGLGLVSQSPKTLALAEALRTGGMSAGGAGMGTRIAGGALSGGAMAGAINPEDAGTGAVLGGALPGVVKAGGEIGKGIKNLVVPKNRAVQKLIEDAGGVEQAKEAIDRAIAAGKTLSGESYTLGQAGKNAGLSATERARSAVNPENFQRIYQAQREARIRALQGIGQDEVALDNAIATRTGNARTAYDAVRDKVFAGGDDLSGLLNRAKAGGALTEAQKIAATEGRKFSIPVVDEPVSAAFQNADEATRAMYSGMRDPGTVTIGSVPAGMPEVGNSRLLAEIRKLGGLSTKDMADLVGERATNKGGAQVGVFTKKGEEVGDMVRRLVDKGVMPRQVLNDVDGGAQALRDAIQRELQGGADNMALRAAAESYYGAPEVLPIARESLMTGARPQEALRKIVGQAVKGGDLHSVKMGIDQAIAGSTGPQKAALMQLKTDFLDWMGKQSPEYLAANAQYAADSRPINQMKVAQRLTDVLTGEGFKHGANAKQSSEMFFRALKNAPSIAKSETGMRQPLNKVFDKDQLNAIKNVAKELAKDTDLQNLGRGVGSDTRQKFARAEMASSLADLINSSRVGRAAVNLGTLGIKNETGRQLDMLLQNPEYARGLLESSTISQPGMLTDLLTNPATRAGLLSSLQSR